MSEPISDRPRESFLPDYKERLETRALRTLAAFVNTGGGLLIVGIREGEDAQLRSAIQRGTDERTTANCQGSRQENTPQASDSACMVQPSFVGVHRLACKWAKNLAAADLELGAVPRGKITAVSAI